jgi:hypothetical protein
MRRDGATAVAQQCEAVVEPCGNLQWGEKAHKWRSQLDRER